MIVRRCRGMRLGSAVFVCLLTLAVASQADAAFPGANGRIVFEVVDRNSDQFISDIRPGERPRRLTRLRRACRGRDSVFWADTSPHYSPDGNWIVYVHEDSYGDYPWEQQLRIMRADGNANRVLLQRRGEDVSLSASFAPDGQRLMVMIRTGDRQRRLIISALTGRVLAGPYPMPAYAFPMSEFRWGPDGRIAAFMELLRPRHKNGLFVGAPGRPLRRFRQRTRPFRHPLLSSSDTDPDWHPSARRIVFERVLDCRLEDRCPIEDSAETLVEHSDVYTVMSNGKPRLRRVTRGGLFADPAFSPDGRRMVAQRWPDLVVGAAAGGQWRTLVRNGASNPEWQPVTARTFFR